MRTVLDVRAKLSMEFGQIYRPIELYRLEWTFLLHFIEIDSNLLDIVNMIASCLLSRLSSMCNALVIYSRIPSLLPYKPEKWSQRKYFTASTLSRIDSLTFFTFSQNCIISFLHLSAFFFVTLVIIIYWLIEIVMCNEYQSDWFFHQTFSHFC